MNNNLITKCLTELNKESPNISYIKGILESILELSNPSPTTSFPGSLNIPYYPPVGIMSNTPGFNVTNEQEESGPGDYVKGTGPIAQLN